MEKLHPRISLTYLQNVLQFIVLSQASTAQILFIFLILLI